MNNLELLHSLKILVEMELEPNLKALDEGTEITDVKKERKKLLKEFMDNLPEEYRRMPGFEKVITSTITNIEKEKKEIRKMRERQDREQR